MRERLERLRQLRERLAGLSAWPPDDLADWTHDARPTILRDWLEHIHTFERLAEPPHWEETAESQADMRRAELWQQNLLGFIDGLIDQADQAARQTFWRTPTGISTFYSLLVALVGLTITIVNLLYQNHLVGRPPVAAVRHSPSASSSAPPSGSATPLVAGSPTPRPPGPYGLTRPAIASPDARPYGPVEPRPPSSRPQPYGYGY